MDVLTFFSEIVSNPFLVFNPEGLVITGYISFDADMFSHFDSYSSMSSAGVAPTAKGTVGFLLLSVPPRRLGRRPTEVRMFQAAVLSFNSFTAAAVSARRTAIVDTKESARELLPPLIVASLPTPNDYTRPTWSGPMPSRSIIQVPPHARTLTCCTG